MRKLDRQCLHDAASRLLTMLMAASFSLPQILHWNSTGTSPAMISSQIALGDTVSPVMGGRFGRVLQFNAAGCGSLRLCLLFWPMDVITRPVADRKCLILFDR